MRETIEIIDQQQWLAQRMRDITSADVDQVIMNDNEASGFTQIQPRETINVTPMPEDQTAPLSRLKASMGSEGIVDNATGEIISEEKNEQPADA